MLVAMSVLTGPGLGRLLPLPLNDTQRVAGGEFRHLCLSGHRDIGRLAPRWPGVHPPALFRGWGLGIYVGVFALSMLVAFSPLGLAVTKWVIAGSPGAERPMEAFMPPGFTNVAARASRSKLSASANLWTLPDPVSGKASTHTQCAGVFCGERRARMKDF